MPKNEPLLSENIYQKAYDLAVKVNLHLRKDIFLALRSSFDALSHKKTRKARVAREFLSFLIDNADIAKSSTVPLCQDTGLVVAFLEVGKGALVSKEAEDAIKRAVEDAYRDAGFRASVVKPIERGRPSYKDSAIVHIEFTNRQKSRLTLLAKGFGSENKSQTKMFLPTSSEKDIAEFVIDVIKKAGPSACPPFVVGVGIGGTLDKATYLSKRSLCLPVDKYRGDYEALASSIYKKANNLKMGVLGLGEGPTVLGVNILSSPTHIAGLPVSVSIGCHSTRSGSVCL